MRPTLRDQRPHEYWRRYATEKRILSAIEFVIECSEPIDFVIWPFDPDFQDNTARLVDHKENWLTAQKGSSVLVRFKGVWNIQRIKAVRLFQVSPEKYCGAEVTSALEWVEGVPGIHESELFGLADGIPSDLRGYIPTEETGPFDLDWPYLRPTHRYNGTKTAFGQQWESYWPELQAQAIEKTRVARETMATEPVSSQSPRFQFVMND